MCGLLQLTEKFSGSEETAAIVDRDWPEAALVTTPGELHERLSCDALRRAGVPMTGRSEERRPNENRAGYTH